jgi:predicted DsbA family dithiol-disulfide isomerase
MEIFYWSDYACPYCYIGETNLKAALRELGIGCVPEMRAFELSPDGPRTCPGPTRDLVAKKYGITAEQAEASMQRINEMAADAGLNMDFGKARYSNTFDAHRLTKLAGSISPEKADALADALFKANFSEGAELADHETLLSAARSAGLEEDAVKALLASDDYADRVRADEEQAHQYGVTGVPYFVINGEYAIPGALTKEQMVGVLRRIMARKAD